VRRVTFYGDVAPGLSLLGVDLNDFELQTRRAYTSVCLHTDEKTEGNALAGRVAL